MGDEDKFSKENNMKELTDRKTNFYFVGQSGNTLFIVHCEMSDNSRKFLPELKCN